MINRRKKVFIFVLLLGIFLTCSWWFVFQYQNWGRKQIFSIDNKKTEFPGSGRIFEPRDVSWLILPIGNGKPSLIGSDIDLDSYPDTQYEKIEIPAQSWLNYFVGLFSGWEDIPGTKDRYLLAMDPMNNTTEKFRVCFERSTLFKDEYTVLMVENVGMQLNKKSSITKARVFDFINIPKETIESMFRMGDAIVVLPVIDLPITTKRDGAGNYLASKIIIRRIGGEAEFNREIAK